jgi:RNA-directed DNA polymerase
MQMLSRYLMVREFGESFLNTELQMTNVSKHIGAPVNHGSQWKNTDWAKAQRMVKRLQMRIAKAVDEERWHKVKALQWMLTHSFYAKLLAVKKVTSNHGAKTPGVDNVTWNTQAEKFLGALSLRRKNYKAQPLKRKEIPKTDGRLRPLGIPTIKDRAMQALYLMALEPISEMTADANSYGFRPHRSCRDAIGQCRIVLGRKNSAEWILDADIKACFDWISHDWLLNNIPMDKQVLQQWLTSGFVYNQMLFPTKSGTPQGGIISPVLANMTLDGLESLVKKTTSLKAYGDKINFIRYADDFIITSKSKELLERKVIPCIQKFLKPRGLELSQEKTHIRRIEDGVDFLGQNLRKYKNILIIKPAKKKVKSFLDKFRRTVKMHNGNSALALIKALNPQVLGWANYHRTINAGKTFSDVDTVTYNTLWRWLKRQHPEKSKTWLVNKYWNQGYNNKRPWIFSAVDSNNKRVTLTKAGDIRLLRYVKVKGNATPYKQEYHDYFQQRIKSRNGQIIDNRTVGLTG